MNRALRSELLRMVAADQAARERVNRQLASDDARRACVGLPPLGDELGRVARNESRHDFPGPPAGRVVAAGKQAG